MPPMRRHADADAAPGRRTGRGLPRTSIRGYARAMTGTPSLGYWLRLVDRLIEDMFENTLGEHGVTRTQWQLMNVLGEGARDRSALESAIAPFTARGSSPDDGSVAELLDELVESEWLVVRTTHFHLTDAGTDALGRLTTIVEAQRERMTEGLAPDDYATTLASLETMARNLGWVPDAG